MNENELGLPNNLTVEEHEKVLLDASGAKYEEVVDATRNSLEDLGDDAMGANIGDDIDDNDDSDSDEIVEVAEDYEDAESMETFPIGYTVKLKIPVTFRQGGVVKTMKTVVFSRALTAGDVENLPVAAAGSLKWGDTLKIIQKCTRVHIKLLRKISSADLLELTSVAMSFFANGPAR